MFPDCSKIKAALEVNRSSKATSSEVLLPKQSLLRRMWPHVKARSWDKSHIKDYLQSLNALCAIFGCQNVSHCVFKINTLCLWESTVPKRSLFHSLVLQTNRPLDMVKAFKDLPYGNSSNVRFYFVQRVVDFCQSLFDAQGCKPRRWVLVPTLFHEFGDGR